MLFAEIVYREAELLDGGDNHFVRVVLGQQAADEGGGVGVFLDAAFLKAVELFPRLAVEVFAVHDEDAFVDVVVFLEQGEALKEVSVLPLPVVCQTKPLPSSSSMHFTMRCTA